MNHCDISFLEWFSKTYAELPEGEDFPCDTEFMHEIWVRCWRRAYTAGIMRGQKQGRMHVERFNVRVRTPMPYYAMEDLFIGCKTGREFGRRVEKWHGIGREHE